MFKGFKWYDWLLGLMTYGIWIVFKVLRNMGLSIPKIIGGVVGAAVIIIGASFIFVNTDTGKASALESALRNNKLDKAEKILSESPQIKTENGLTASEVVEKIKANLKTEEERLAKEKAEADKKAAEQLVIAKKKAAKQLAIAKSKGYDSYEAYQMGEAEIIAKEKEKAKTERIAKERKVEAERITKQRAERTLIVDREELGRVISRPEKYNNGKIIKSNLKNKYGNPLCKIQFSKGGSQYMKISNIEVIGTNWKSKRGVNILVPMDIYNKMDSDLYKKFKTDILDYNIKVTDIDLIILNGSSLKKLLNVKVTHGFVGSIDNGGRDKTGLYTKDEDLVMIIPKIVSPTMGTYITKQFSY